MDKESLFLDVCYITDYNYVELVKTSVSTLLQNNLCCRLWIVALPSAKMSFEDAKRHFSEFSNTTVIDASKYDSMLDSVKSNGKIKHVSKAAVLKMMLPSILPLDRVLYLDCDTIVNKSIQPLHNVNLENKFAAVVPDMVLLDDRYLAEFINAETAGITYPKIVADNHGYFNSGVMLLNLKLMRQEDMSKKLIDFGQSHNTRYIDQDTFNIVFAGKVVWLPETYNTLMDRIRKTPEKYTDPVVLHLAGPKKDDVYAYCRTHANKIDVALTLTTYPVRGNSVLFREKVLKSLLSQDTNLNYRIFITLVEDEIGSFTDDFFSFCFENGIDFIIGDKNLRPHNKYFYIFQKDFDFPVITVDDDSTYRPYMVERLMESYKKHPSCVHSGNSKYMVDKGPETRWVEWEHTVKIEQPRKAIVDVPSKRIYAQGIGAVLYPPHVMHITPADIQGEDFNVCAYNDDLLLYLYELRHGIKVVQLGKRESDRIRNGGLFEIIVDALNKVPTALYLRNLGKDENSKLMRHYYAEWSKYIQDEPPYTAVSDPAPRTQSPSQVTSATKQPATSVTEEQPVASTIGQPTTSVTEQPATLPPNGKHDLVYVLGSGSRFHNQEIKISIASMMKYCSSWINRIYIVGEDPHIDNPLVTVIRCPDPYHHAKDANIIYKIQYGIDHIPNLTEDFLFCSDDQMITKKSKWEDFYPRYISKFNRDSFAIARSMKERNNTWSHHLWGTMARILDEKYEVYYYQPHIFAPFNKTNFTKMTKSLDLARDEYVVIMTLYYNKFPPSVIRPNADHTFFPHAKIKSVADADRCFRARHIAFTDKEFKDVGFRERLLKIVAPTIPEKAP